MLHKCGCAQWPGLGRGTSFHCTHALPENKGLCFSSYNAGSLPEYHWYCRCYLYYYYYKQNFTLPWCTPRTGLLVRSSKIGLVTMLYLLYGDPRECLPLRVFFVRESGLRSHDSEHSSTWVVLEPWRYHVIIWVMSLAVPQQDCVEYIRATPERTLNIIFTSFILSRIWQYLRAHH